MLGRIKVQCPEPDISYRLKLSPLIIYHLHTTPPHGGYPMRPGVSIIYRAPSYSTYSQGTNSYVYGGWRSSIESRDYVLITDWRRLGIAIPT